MISAPANAAMGMIQLTVASVVASPKYETAAAAPAIRRTPATTYRTCAGAGARLTLHSNGAKIATSTTVTVARARSHIGLVSHHFVVPGSIWNAAPPNANRNTDATRVIAVRCHR